MQRAGIEHHAWRRTPPEDRLAGAVPGKDAAAVGVQDPCLREVSTDCKADRWARTRQARIRKTDIGRRAVEIEDHGVLSAR